MRLPKRDSAGDRQLQIELLHGQVQDDFLDWTVRQELTDLRVAAAIASQGEFAPLYAYVWKGRPSGLRDFPTLDELQFCAVLMDAMSPSWRSMIKETYPGLFS